MPMLDDLVIIDGVVMGSRSIIIPAELQKQALEQNVDIGKILKHCSACLGFQQTHPKEKIIPHEIPGKQWEAIGMDMFSSNNSSFLCVVHYHSKSPIVKKSISRQPNNLL